MSFRYTIETENPIVIDGNKMFNTSDGKLRLKIVDESPWHTGTPTDEIKENDWYTFAYKLNGEIRYITVKEPSFWYFTNCDTLAWQKVEPFETSKEN